MHMICEQQVVDNGRCCEILAYPHLSFSYTVLLEKLSGVSIAAHGHNVQLLLCPFVQFARSVCCFLMVNEEQASESDLDSAIPDESDVHTKSTMHGTAV